MTQAGNTRTTTPTPSPTQPNLQAEFMHRAAWKAAVMGTLNVLLIVAAVRITLLVAVLGAAILAFADIQTPEPLRLGALATYAALVVLPMVWLCSRR
jgi:hypothetical protein